MGMSRQVSIDEKIKLVCPIAGVSFGKIDDKTTWRISFLDEATQSEREAAQTVIDEYDFLDDYKQDAIEENQIEAGRRIALLFGSVDDGYLPGSEKLRLKQSNNTAESISLILKEIRGTNVTKDDNRIAVLLALLVSLNSIIDAENSVVPLIDSALNEAAVDAVTVLWPTTERSA